MILTFDAEETKKLKALKNGETFELKGVRVKREPKTFAVYMGLVRVRFTAEGLENYKELKVQLK